MTFAAVTAPSRSSAVPTEPRGSTTSATASPGGLAERGHAEERHGERGREDERERFTSSLSASLNRFLAGTLAT